MKYSAQFSIFYPKYGSNSGHSSAPDLNYFRNKVSNLIWKLVLGFFLRAFEQGSHGLPMWSKGVFDYNSGGCCFEEVKTTSKILIVLAF